MATTTTDGSLRNGRGASGFAVWSNSLLIHAETWKVAADSSFAAELQAIQGAFAYIVSAPVSGRVLFLVDNVTAMLQIFDTSLHHNQDCSIRAMKYLSIWLRADHQNNLLTMSWCPSHSGLHENDTIDRMVGERIRLRNDQQLQPFMSLAAAQKNLEKELLNKWDERLRSPGAGGSQWLRPRGSRGRVVKPSMGKTAKKRWLLADNNIETFCRTLRFQTGHMPSGEFNNRIRRQEYGFCSFCEGAPHSRRHIYEECSKYKRTQGSTLLSLSTSRSSFAKTVQFFKDNPTAGTFIDCPATDVL